MITAILGALGAVLTVKIAKRRAHVWQCFAAAFAVALAVLILAVHHYPYGQVRPGSDYDIAMKNFFLRGLGYCASPGPAALLAALAAWLTAKQSTDQTPAPNPSGQSPPTHADPPEGGPGVAGRD